MAGYQDVETIISSTGQTPGTTTDPTATANQKKALSGGSVAAIIGSCVFGLLLGLALTLVLCVRRQQSSKHLEAAKLSGPVARFELNNDKTKVFELSVTKKPLPATPDDVGVRELEGHEWVQEIAGPARLPNYGCVISVSG